MCDNLYAWSSFGPQRDIFVFRRCYKHDRQRVPWRHEVILDLCVVCSYTWQRGKQQLNWAWKSKTHGQDVKVCQRRRRSGGGGGGGGGLFVEALACELVVEVDHQRVVPPVKAWEQMKETKEAHLRRAEKNTLIHMTYRDKQSVWENVISVN